MSQGRSIPSFDPTIGGSGRADGTGEKTAAGHVGLAADGRAEPVRTAGGNADRPEPMSRGERQARLLADTIPHIVWTADGEGQVEYFNGRWYEYTGLSVEQTLSTMGWRSAIHPEDIGRLLSQRAPAVEEGQPFQADIRLRDREGNYRWHIVRSVPVCDDEGRVIHRFGTATDIDDRRRAEEALRAGEQRFRFLAESIPHLVWTCRPDGVVEYASPRLMEDLRVAPGEPLHPAWADAMHPEDRARVLAVWDQSLRTGAEYHIEYRLRDAEGQYRWFRGHALPHRDESGRLAGWYGTFTDIDSQWRGRQEIIRLNRDLKARVDELEALFETVPIAIAIAEDDRCTRIRANPAMERLLEVAPAANTSLTAPAGERPTHLHFRRDGRDVAPEDLPIQIAAREGRTITGDTLEAVFADGHIRVIHGNAAPLFDEDGRPRGALGAFIEVTELRRVEAGAGRQRGAASPGHRGDRPGPVRPRPDRRHPPMVRPHPGDLRPRAQRAHYRRAIPADDLPRGSRADARQPRPRHGPRHRRPLRHRVPLRPRRWLDPMGPFRGPGRLRGSAATGRRAVRLVGALRDITAAQASRGAVEGGQGGRRDRQPRQGPVPRHAQPRAAHPAGAGRLGRRAARDDPRPLARGHGLPGDDPPSHRPGDPPDRRPAGPQPGDQRQAPARPPADAPERPGRARHGHRRRRGPRQGADRRDDPGGPARPGGGRPRRGCSR